MATEVTSIGVGMETDGVERGIRTLQQLASQGPRVEKSMQGIEAAASKVDNSLKGFGDGADKGLKALTVVAPGAEQGLKRVGRSAEETKRYIDNLHRSITGIGTIQTAPVARSFDSVKTSALDASKAVDLLKSTLAVTGIGIGVKEVISLADGYTKFTAQLKLASKSAEDYAASMTAVRRISLDAQQGLAETGTLYARIANGTAELGLSQQKLSDITETVALGLKVSGATASESASAMLQLSQAFASGVLRGEEFNAVNESAPRLMKALADGIGVPVGALREFASEGKITSQVMADALPKALEKIRKEAEQIQTIGGSFTVLKNNLLEFVGAGDKASGATKAISTSITGLANNLDTIAVAAGGLALILAGRYVGAMAAASASTAAMAASTARANVAAVALAASISPAAAAVSAFGVAARGASAALSLFGGPIGLAVTAIGAATAAFLYFRDTTEETIKSIGGLNQPLEDLKKKLDDLPPEKRVSVIIDIEKAGRDAIKEAESDIESLVQSVAGASSIKMPLDEFEKLTDSIRDTAKSGGDLTPILQKAAQSGGIPQSVLQSWLNLAAGIREAQAAAGQAQALANAAPKVEIMGPTIAQRDAQAQRDAADALKGAAAYKSKAEQMAEVRSQGDKLRAALGNLTATNQGTSKAAEELRARLVGVDERLASMAKSGKSAAGGAKQVENAYHSLSKRVNEYIEQLRIEALQGDKATAAQKAQIQLNDLLARSKGKVTAAKVAGLQADIQTALLMEKEAQAIKLAADQSEEAAKAYDSVLDAAERRADGLRKQIQTEQDAAAAIGLSKDAVAALEAAKLEEMAASIERRAVVMDDIDLSGQQSAALRAEAQAYKDLASAKIQRGIKQANYDTAKQAEKDWEKVSETIGRSLSDYIMGGGKDAAQYLKRLFSTLVLQPIVQTAVGSIFGGAGGAQAMLGGGNGGVLGTASNLNSLYGAFSGGITSSIGGAIGGLGSMLGSSALTSFSAGIKGSTLAAGLAGPTTAGASGAMGLGASFGAALPWLAGGLAIASLFGGDLFKKSTPHMGAAAVYKGGEVSRGWMPEGQFQEGMFTAIGGIAQSIGSALDATAESFGKKAGYTLSTVFSDDTSKDKAFGGLSIIGPDGQKIADWSGFDKKWGGKRFSDGEAGYKEYLAALTEDVKTAFRAMDLPGWADQILAAATDLDAVGAALQQISAVKSVFDGLGKSMSMFADLSGSVQTTLLNVSGGIEALSNNAQSFYANYYTEQERLEATTKSLTEQLSKYGATLPETAEQYRELVEQQMAAGDAGAEFAAVLLGLNGAFKSVADAWSKELEGMADSVASVFSGIKDEIASVLSDVAGTRKDILRGTGAMTAAEIQAAINAALIYAPSTAGVAKAQGTTSAATSTVAYARYAADRSAAEYAARMNAVNAAGTNLASGEAKKAALEKQARELVDWINSLWDGGANSGYSYGKRKKWSDEAAAKLEEVNRAIAAMNPNLAKMREEVARQQAIAAQAGKVSQADADRLAAAQAALDAAQKDEVKAKAEYAAQLNKFVQDASGSVSKLSDLRGEVVSFYEAQAQAVEAMIQSASNLRSVVDSVRLGQLTTAQTARELGNRYALDYSMALATTGTTRAGYVDAMAGNLQSLTDAIKAEAISSTDWQIQTAKLLAQATNAANLLEGDAETQDYQDTALSLLDSIDAALKNLEATTKTGEQIIADAVNKGTASTLTGLRAVVAALKGEPVPAFAVGTNYVPRDMLAQIHEGEAIVPKAFNPWAGGGMPVASGGSSKQMEVLMGQLIDEQRVQSSRMVELQMQMNKRFDRWDVNGLPEVREV